MKLKVVVHKAKEDGYWGRSACHTRIFYTGGHVGRITVEYLRGN